MYASMDTPNTDTFAWVDWLIAEREKKDWTQSELSRKAGITRQTINDYESRRRSKPDEQILMKISEALGYPPEHLPRLAGLFPPEKQKDETLYRIEHLYHTLHEPTNKQRALEYLEYLKQSEEKNDRQRKKPK